MVDRGDDSSIRTQRKQSRPTRARGRAGYRRFEEALEEANVVVQRVDPENDIGRDAFVDIVDGTDVTGGVICVQVKSGRATHLIDGRWMLPGKPADFTLWRESTVPFFGVLYDELDGALRWVDLSGAAALALSDRLSPVVPGRYGKPSVQVPDGNRLDLDVPAFLAAAEAALRRRSGLPVAALMSGEEGKVENGIYDAFAMGRHDPTPFTLLSTLIQRLPRATRRLAITALAMATSHPDIFWTRDNWIPEEVRRSVREQVRWSELDISLLLSEVDEHGFQRGSFGQTVFHVLQLDQDLERKLSVLTTNRSWPDEVRLWATAILLHVAGDRASVVLDQLLRTDEQVGSTEALFDLTHSLLDVKNFGQLIQSVQDFGYVELF